MTTLAYDGRTIAGDKLATWGGKMRLFEAVDKLIPWEFNERKGFYLAAGSPAEMGKHMRETLAQLDLPTPMRERFEGTDNTYAILIVYNDVVGGPHKAYRVGSEGSTGDITGMRFAVGSGEEYAFGAMDHGATAFEAVKIASKRDVYTGFDVEWLDLNAVPSDYQFLNMGESGE